MAGQHSGLELLAALSSGQEAIEAIPRLQPGLLLLDIQLKDKTAFEMLDAIQASIHGHIIFVTAYDHYAIRAFEVEAVDYLLKPFDTERFDAAIQKVLAREQKALGHELLELLKQQARGKNTQLVIPEGNRNHLFRPEEISCILADGYYVQIKGTRPALLIRSSLKKLEHLLPDEFLRVNKSTIVNTRQISRIDTMKQRIRIVLNDGHSFDATRVYQEAVRKKLSFFL
jgi:DNA-binding LytR/AlgR family response regulator